MTNTTAAKLIEVAATLFAQKGFTGVSIRELAIAADANSALISYHFGGKEGLYKAVLEQQFSQVSEDVNSIIEAKLPPLDRIARFAEMIINTHKRNPQLLRLVNSELSNPTPCFASVIQHYIGRNYQVLCQAISDGIAAGDVREDIQPGFAALSLAGMINFYFLAKPLEEKLLSLDAASDHEYGRQAIEIYLNGIRRKLHE